MASQHGFNFSRSLVTHACILGKKSETGEVVSIGDVARRSGVYMLGKPGMGKTTLLVNLILQDIAHGHGICFLDPHGDAIEEVLKRLPDQRVNDVILLDPLDRQYAIGLNLFHCTDPTDERAVSRTVDYVMAIFAKLFADGDLSKMPQMAQVLRNTTLTLIENPGMTMAEIPLLFDVAEARAKLVRNVTNPQVQSFWARYNSRKPQEQREFTSSTVNKLDEFLALPFTQYIVGQRTTIDFRAIMDEGKILLVKLPREQAQLTTLVGTLIIGQLLNAVYSRDDTPEQQRRHFCLYCDEFQNFATPDFAKLITEGRKYRIATTIVHQERASQLEKDDKNRGATLAAANMILFQTTVTDAEELAPEFARPPQPAWEEEIAKEWYERIEEEVTDYIEEDVEEITTNPVDYLLSARGTHPSIGVRNAVRMALLPLTVYKPEETEEATRAKHEINRLLVYCMENKWGSEEYRVQRVFELFNTCEFLWKLWPLHEKYLKLCFVYDEAKEREKEEKGKKRPYWYGDGRGKYNFHDPYFISPRQLSRRDLQLEESYRKTLIRLIEGCGSENSIDERSKDLGLLTIFYRLYESYEYAYMYAAGTHQPQPGSSWWYTADAKWNTEIKIIAMQEDQARAKLQEELRQLLGFLTGLNNLCWDLQRDPIKVPTGQKRSVPRKRTQIHYLTHPRQTILHPQRAYQDMVNEMAQELANLPRFTAYAKIIEEAGGQQKVGKYKLSLDRLPSADNEPVVKQRNQTIRTNTILSGYSTEREQIKQELAARRTALITPEKKKGQTTSDEDEE